MFNGGDDYGLAAIVFPETSSHISDVGAGQGMLRLLSMMDGDRINHTRLCVPGGVRGGGGRGGREGGGGGPGEGDRCRVVVEYLILFAVVNLLCLMAMAGILMRAVVEIVTMMVMTVVSMAFICISVCVVEHCVPTTHEHRNVANF